MIGKINLNHLSISKKELNTIQKKTVEQPIVSILPTKNILRLQIKNYLRKICNTINEPGETAIKYVYFSQDESDQILLNAFRQNLRWRNQTIDLIKTDISQPSNIYPREVYFQRRYLTISERKQRAHLLKKAITLKHNSSQNNIKTFKPDIILNHPNQVYYFKNQLISKTSDALKDFLKIKPSLTPIEKLCFNLFVDAQLKIIEKKIIDSLNQCAINLISKNAKKFNIALHFFKTLNDISSEIFDDEFIDNQYPLSRIEEKRIFRELSKQLFYSLAEKIAEPW